uniref:Putative secreted protein n=1 Tax=Anopheles darlingi TaxID=43151 RepID=A0A2M4D477_ANODA
MVVCPTVQAIDIYWWFVVFPVFLTPTVATIRRANVHQQCRYISDLIPVPARWKNTVFHPSSSSSSCG